MSVLGKQFYFPFAYSTRVDVAFSHLGDEETDVEVTVFDGRGNQVHARRFQDVPQRGSRTSRSDAKADNLSRFVGANLCGLVAIEGGPNALLTASSLVIGKGMTSCALLRPVCAAAGVQMIAPVAIGKQFYLLLANPFVAEIHVAVEAAPEGDSFRALQPPVALGPHQVVTSEDVFALGKPAVVRASCIEGTPFIAWALGIGANRSELYPLHP